MDAVCSLLCSWHPGDGMSCEQVNGDYRDLDNLFRTWESLSPTMHHFLVWTCSWVPCFCSFSTEIAYKSTMLAVISQMSPTSLRCCTDFWKICAYSSATKSSAIQWAAGRRHWVTANHGDFRQLSDTWRHAESGEVWRELGGSCAAFSTSERRNLSWMYGVPQGLIWFKVSASSFLPPVLLQLRFCCSCLFSPDMQESPRARHQPDQTQFCDKVSFWVYLTGTSQRLETKLRAMWKTAFSPFSLVGRAKQRFYEKS